VNKSIKFETALSRAVLPVATLICLAGAIFFAKWYFANSISLQAPSKDVAEFSADLAPNDPQTHYALAVLNEKTFLPEDLSKSLAEFEQATALAPHDFRLWLALGKARERSGNAAGAEAALRKALALAPNYAAAQWTLGNVLLRRGKTAEAFNEIRRSAANDVAYRNQTITTAWQIFDGDLAAVRQHIGDAPNLNSALAVFLAKSKRFDEAFDIWSGLPSEEKKTTLKSDGENLFGAMLAEKKYRDALRVQQSISDQPNAERFAPGKIFNGGFETEVMREKAGIFDWQIADGAQPQIGFDDAQRHDGNRSLVIIYNSATGREFRLISQTAVVEAGKTYAFELFYKSDLKTAATFRWEIVDASDGKVLAATGTIAASADWTNLKAEFTTSNNTQAVTVRLAREACKSIVCPISGKVWFDDFAIN
jgi:tetratricopeptide (TPR) repeat protein